MARCLSEVQSTWVYGCELLRRLGTGKRGTKILMSSILKYSLQLEGERGTYLEEYAFDLQPFFDAAKTAGIYLLARPGPYINAEVSGGGFPGWVGSIVLPVLPLPS
jgi:hypothetical protein